MEISERQKDIISPLDAVSDAILVAYAEQVLAAPKQLNTHNINDILEPATANSCHFASARSIYFLTEKYPNLFTSTFLLSSTVFEKGDLIREKRQSFHRYFLTLGTDSYWYAGSPANHDRGSKNGYALELLREKSIGDILKDIVKRDGGIWPKEAEILSIINGPQYSKPRIVAMGHLDTILIESSLKGTEAREQHIRVKFH